MKTDLIQERRLLFYGELPPDAIHGIAISNQINLKMLKSSFHISIVEEKNRLSEHSKISVNKFINAFKNGFTILFRSILKRYDYLYLIFSLSTFGCLKTLFVIMFFRLFNKGKIVLHIHRGDFFSRFYQVKINRILTNLIFSLSHKIIVLSETQKSEFEFVFKRPFHVLCNTIENEHEVLVLKKDNKRFIYISNYLTEKGIIDLLQVFRRLTSKYPQILLSTYGSFPSREMEEKLLKYKSSRILINGPISGDEKFQEISDSDCLILPSWNEGQPIVLLEAMSVGTPVIASNVGMIPELLGNDYPYFSKARDQSSLEDTIVRFINEVNTEQISENLKSRYTNFYSQQMHEVCLKNIFI